jgi:hypothetical protein
MPLWDYGSLSCFKNFKSIFQVSVSFLKRLFLSVLFLVFSC